MLFDPFDRKLCERHSKTVRQTCTICTSHISKKWIALEFLVATGTIVAGERVTKVERTMHVSSIEAD